MDVLYLSHCVPNPPDKGEKIRAYHEVTYLASRCRLHLACFARDESEVEAAHELKDRCASVYVERLSRKGALIRAAIRFALGGCLNKSYYWSPRLMQYVTSLVRQQTLKATLVYAAVMAQYAPSGVPILLDMQDVDSEKWLQYALSRQPSFLYALEAHRLRTFEADCARAAQRTILTTENEVAVLHSFATEATMDYMENGSDSTHFDGLPHWTSEELKKRRFVAFVGTMDYFPNIQAACWFASRVFPKLRQQEPGLEFLIIGRSPTKRVLNLSRRDKGITVTGGVADVRQYLASARAVVAPLQLACGIQNKVLESLMMGRPVFASAAVCRTFGWKLPRGVVCCGSEADFVDRVGKACREAPVLDPEIREEARQRFSWPKNLGVIMRNLEELMGESSHNCTGARGLHG